MALTAAEIESAEPNPWTGKLGALVYEATADVATWLTRRGKTVFAGLEAADQEVKLIEATEAGEDVLRGLFRGRPVTTGQGLLFPAYGAYDGHGYLIPSDTAPRQYLEGLRLIAEELAAGTYMALVDAGLVGVRAEHTRASGVEYREGVDVSTLSANHPAIWRKLRMAVPRMI